MTPFGILFWTLAALVAGITLLVWALSGSPRSRATDILAERLARGEIASDDYRERLATLRLRERPPALLPLGMALSAIGLVGVLFVSAAFGFRHMRGMMTGHDDMDGMMRHMRGMMRGEAGRSGAQPPLQGAEEVRVAGFEFGFEPRETRVRAGETVNLVFDNRGHMFHTLTIGRLGFELRTNGGESIGAALRAEEPGRYDYVCTVPGHAEAGMRGVLVVDG
jgi:plastocyanin